MSSPLISVIVPVYKAEKYLDQCVGSIAQQTYTNLEIILVDDGSPDRSPAICDVWAEKDGRIKVIHKENGGAAQARNCGMTIAHGDFIAFVDSDDFIASHMYAQLVAVMTDDVDIAECSIVYTDSATAAFDGYQAAPAVRKVSSEEALRLHIQNKAFCQTPVNKVYRTAALDGILFVEGKTFDDEFWTYRAIGNARALVRTEQHLYAYRQQPQSVMHMRYNTTRLQEIEARLIRHRYLLDRYPALAGISRVNMLFTCMYHMQLSMEHLTADRADAMKTVRDVAKAYPVQSNDLKLLPGLQKIWVILSKLSFDGTCKLRKLLRIGY